MLSLFQRSRLTFQLIQALHRYIHYSIDQNVDSVSKGWATSMLALATCYSWLPTSIATTPVPVAPKLSFLYTACVEYDSNLMDTSVRLMDVLKVEQSARF